MGTVAVLADIHGNLAALEAVLTALKPIKPRAYWVLGDVFGELGQARAVLDRLRELNAFCLMGNRERDMAAYIRGEKPEWQGAMQFAALTESARGLRSEMTEIASWPMTAIREGVRLVHGSPADVYGEYAGGLHYVLRVRLVHGSPADVYELMHPGTPRVDELLAAMAEPSMVAGHDHKQWYYSRWDKAIFAAGSVGLAHTGRPCQAEYLILERQDGGWHGRFCRTCYHPQRLKALLEAEAWLERGGPLARAAYEEALTGGYAILDFVRLAQRMARRLGPQAGGVLPDEAIQMAAQAYPWTTL